MCFIYRGMSIRSIHLSLFLVASCAVQVGSACAQQTKDTIKATPAQVELVPGNVPDVNKELEILLQPCKGEQPGNVLGISEQAPLPERVAGFTRKLRESDPKTRACAVKQLGYLGPNAENAVHYLIQLLHTEKNTNVLSHIEDALWAIGPGQATHNLADAMLNRKELLEMISAPNV